ncbi:MAG: cation:proton antiporter [Nitrososphaerota archaeon]|nr:cation:proton antiporter [Nitrososphaerota archaeon]
MLYEIIWQVLVVLAVAVLLGEVFERFSLPAVAGELLSGLLLGPMVFGIVISDSETQAISSISLFFIIYLIGLEMKTETLAKHVLKASVISITSFILPLAIVSVLSITLFHFGLVSDLIVALAISVPSISIISVMVMQFDLLKSDSGQIIMASVAITDILAFILLAMLSYSFKQTLMVILYVVIFLVAFVLIDRLVNSKVVTFQNILKVGAASFRREEISFAIIIIVGLLVAEIFQFIGTSFIIGAFFAGLIIHEELIGKEAFGKISRTFTRINSGFFIPLFFGFAGIEAERFVASQYGLFLILVVLLIAALGVGIPLTYLVSKHFIKESDSLGTPRQISVILAGKGAVGIVIITVALNSGLVDGAAYSIVILGTVLTSIFAPLLIKRSPKAQDQNES